MKILIATPSFPPRVAGPSQYAKSVAEVWRDEGADVVVVSFDAYLHMPSGIRHLAYAWALFREARSASFVLALDIFSVALPAVFVSRMLRIKCIVRVSGDFIWEGFVERGGKEVTLREFYSDRRIWSWRERLLFALSRMTLRSATGLVFQNDWQRSLVVREFGLTGTRTIIVRNSFPKSDFAGTPSEKIFIWAGRPIRLKNVERMKQAFAEAEAIDSTVKLRMYTSLTREELFERMRDAYAIINPSLSDMNPNFVLEGISQGKPFICTEESGIREVTEGMGLFVNPKSVPAIRDAVLLLAHSDVYDHARRIILARGKERTYHDVAHELFAFAESL